MSMHFLFQAEPEEVLPHHGVPSLLTNPDSVYLVVQVGVVFELCALPRIAVYHLEKAIAADADHRTISGANATGRLLTDACFTCGGKKLDRTFRRARLTRDILEKGLEYRGVPVEVRVIRTEGGVTAHLLSRLGRPANILLHTLGRPTAEG